MEKISNDDLQDFIDGKLTEKDGEEIRKELEKDAELKSAYKILLEVHKRLENLPLLKVSEGFSSRVMANLYNAKYQPSSYFQRRNLLTLFSIIIGVAIGIYILSSNIANIPIFNNLNINPIGIQDQTIDINTYLNIFTSDFFIKVFLFFDLILALFLLDIAVLKPYFKNRRRTVSY